jgi:hypothetical protein
MFCPNCRTEYRAGFTKCADCDVDLVATLPAEDADVPTDADGLELLWTGVSAELNGRIDKALDDAHIFHKSTSQRLRASLQPSAVNFIWIDKKDRVASRAILERTLASAGATEQEDETNTSRGRFHFLGENSANYDAASVASDGLADNAPVESGELPDAGDNGEPTPDDVVEAFDEADATAEVWAGEDEQTADYLRLSLNGVGIGCVVSDGSGKRRVLVMPESEKRAKEIVREVVEGTLPE